jgi:hypothetical protein
MQSREGGHNKIFSVLDLQGSLTPWLHSVDIFVWYFVKDIVPATSIAGLQMLKT